MYDTFDDVVTVQLEEDSSQLTIQYNIGDAIRKELNSNEFIEFVRYKEKPNKIKFTCMNDKNIFFGSLEIIVDNGIIKKIEIYPRYKNSMDYKELVNDLYKNAGKSQKQIAHRLNLSQATVSRILSS